MNEYLQALLNSKIVGIQWVCDYYQILGNSFKINIYNPINFYKYNSDRNDLECVNLSNIVNHIIIDITYIEEHSIMFDLDNGRIIVSLIDKAYNSPEALSIHFDSGKIMVI